MKLIIDVGIIAVALSLTGCVSNQISDLDARVSALEKNPPVLDDVTQKVLNIAISGPMSHNNKPSQIDAILALALFEKTETAPEILCLAKATQNNHFRMECINALGWMKYEAAIPFLKDAMKNDSYKYARRSAAVALENITGNIFLTPENGFETNEMILDAFRKDQAEKRKLANLQADPAVKTPIESGNEQGTAGHP